MYYKAGQLKLELQAGARARARELMPEILRARARVRGWDWLGGKVWG